jgi:hypothetical protein
MAVKWLENGPAWLFLPQAPPLEAVTGGIVLALIVFLVLAGVLARVVVEGWLDGS